MAVNLDAMFLGTKQAIRAMQKNGGGSIIDISVIEGIVADPNVALPVDGGQTPSWI